MEISEITLWTRGRAGSFYGELPGIVQLFRGVSILGFSIYQMREKYHHLLINKKAKNEGQSVKKQLKAGVKWSF
tara:strand:- start:222 stop:443 length:222 start_codon:yes stop_codon:yes gene_type:complete